MPCVVDISDNQMSNHFEVLLCKSFKYLTREQIKKVVNPGSGILDGIDWYSEHLMFDYSKKCWDEDIFNFDRETNEIEKENILKELNRIGYDLVIQEGSIELITKSD